MLKQRWAVVLLLLGIPFTVLASSSEQGADPIAPIIFSFSGFLILALVGQAVARRLGLPTVLGELAIGVVAGNALYVLGLDLALVLREGSAALDIATKAMPDDLSCLAAAQSKLDPETASQLTEILQGPYGGIYLQILQTIDVLAKYGLIFLLFLVGLGTSISELKKTGVDSVRVAFLGSLIPFVLGMATVMLLQPAYDLNTAIFVGATLAATSIGITARVLSDMHQDQAREGRVILGAAVLDDILGLILLAVVSGVIVMGELSVAVVAKVLGQTALFFLLAYFGTPFLLRGMKALMRHAEAAEVKIMVSVIFAMVLAWTAKVLSLATIIGAFTAGVLLHERNFSELDSDNEKPYTVRDLISPLKITLAPLFFVFMGFQVKLEAFLDPSALIMAVALTGVAMAGKLLAGFGARRGVNRLAIGLAMMPRGEVGLIFASVGKGLGVVPDALFSAIVIMVVVTTLVTPVLLERVLGTKPSSS